MLFRLVHRASTKVKDLRAHQIRCTTHYRPPQKTPNEPLKRRNPEYTWHEFDPTPMSKKGSLGFLTDFLINITYNYDISPPALYNQGITMELDKIKSCQLLTEQSLGMLGADVALSHVIVRLGGAVKAAHREEWYLTEKDLPQSYMRDFYIEAIDVSGSHITFEGLSHIDKLKHLQFLSMRRCPFIDDHALSKVSRLSHSLQVLDISYCPQISARGIATLWSLRRLKKLILYGQPFLEDKELVCLLLEDKLPHLYIEGVNYLSALPRETRLQLLDDVAQKRAEEKLLNTGKEEENVETHNASTAENDNPEISQTRTAIKN